MCLHRNFFIVLTCGTSFAAPSALAADFNGDGFEDLMIGCRRDTVDGSTIAGSVSIVYGDPSAFAAISVQTLTQASFGTLTAIAESESFGFAIQAGDFNGDGFDDIAITSYGETISGKPFAGMVLVAYGSAIGLLTGNAQVFHQDSPGVKDKVEAHPTIADFAAESFGTALAAGDFDGDGFDDLAIGVHETLGTKKKPKVRAGGVHVLRGSADGLTADGDKFFTQDSPGIPGKSKANMLFGWSLAAADFDGNGIDDLAIGAIDNDGTRGTVTILRGKSGKGLSGKNSVVIDELDAGGTASDPQNSHFAYTLEVGDFSGSGDPELVVGAISAVTGGLPLAGAVYVLTLSKPGLEIVEATHLARGNPGVDGPLQAEARFGGALTVGDFNDDGYDDLAVGAASDDVAGIDGAGSINVFTGSATGISTVDHFVTQSTPLVVGAPEEFDQFGYSLAAGDFDADGDADLAIGTPYEAIGAIPGCGVVIVIEGSTSSVLDYSTSRMIDKSQAAIPGDPAANVYFGLSLGR